MAVYILFKPYNFHHWLSTPVSSGYSCTSGILKKPKRKWNNCEQAWKSFKLSNLVYQFGHKNVEICNQHNESWKCEQKYSQIHEYIKK